MSTENIKVVSSWRINILDFISLEYQDFLDILELLRLEYPGNFILRNRNDKSLLLELKISKLLYKLGIFKSNILTLEYPLGWFKNLIL